MTSRESFEAKYGKRGDRLSVAAWDIRLSVWQAAERGMLERCVAKLAENDSLMIFTDDAIEELKELLNEQH